MLATASSNIPAWRWERVAGACCLILSSAIGISRPLQHTKPNLTWGELARPRHREKPQKLRLVWPKTSASCWSPQTCMAYQPVLQLPDQPLHVTAQVKHLRKNVGYLWTRRVKLAWAALWDAQEVAGNQELLTSVLMSAIRPDHSGKH